MKKTEDIKKILLSFYEGQTTHEEERMLYVYFLTETNLPEELEVDKQVIMSLFASLEKREESLVPSGFDDRLNRLLAKFEAENKEKALAPRRKFRKLLWAGGIAASLVVGIAIGINYIDPFSERNVAENVEERDTFTNPEDAYKATEGALLYTSAKMNKVLARLEKSSDKSGTKN